jgi:hypothetical protein
VSADRKPRSASWLEAGIAWALLSAGVASQLWGGTTAAADGWARIQIALAAGVVVFAGGLFVIRREPPMDRPEPPPLAGTPRWFFVVLIAGTLSASAFQFSRTVESDRAARLLDEFSLTHRAALDEAGADARDVIRATDEEGALAAHGSALPRDRAASRRRGRAALELLPDATYDHAYVLLELASAEAWTARLERDDAQRATAPRRGLMSVANGISGARTGWIDGVLWLLGTLALVRSLGVVVAAGCGAWAMLSILSHPPEPGLALLRADVFMWGAFAVAALGRGRAALAGVSLGVLGMVEPSAWPVVVTALIGLHVGGDEARGGARPLHAWGGLIVGMAAAAALSVAITGGYDLGTAWVGAVDPPTGRLGFAVGVEYAGERTPFDLEAHMPVELGRARIVGAILGVLWLVLAGWHARQRNAATLEWADIGVVAGLFGVLGGWTALPLLGICMASHLAHLHRATNVFGAGALLLVAATVAAVDGWGVVPYGQSGMVSVALTAYALLRLIAELDAVARRGVASRHAALLVGVGLLMQLMWVSQAWHSGGVTRPARILAASALRSPLRSGAQPGDKGVREIDRDGVTVKFAYTAHAKRMDMGLGVRQSYRIEFWNERDLVGTMTTRHKSLTIEGVARVRKDVPEHIQEVGWDALAIYPELGDPPFLLGHVIGANDPARPKAKNKKARNVKGRKRKKNEKRGERPKPGERIKDAALGQGPDRQTSRLHAVDVKRPGKSPADGDTAAAETGD